MVKQTCLLRHVRNSLLLAGNNASLFRAQSITEEQFGKIKLGLRNIAGIITAVSLEVRISDGREMSSEYRFARCDERKIIKPMGHKSISSGMKWVVRIALIARFRSLFT